MYIIDYKIVLKILFTIKDTLEMTMLQSLILCHMCHILTTTVEVIHTLSWLNNKVGFSIKFQYY